MNKYQRSVVMECRLNINEDMIHCNKCKSPNIRNGKTYCNRYKTFITKSIQKVGSKYFKVESFYTNACEEE